MILLPSVSFTLHCTRLSVRVYGFFFCLYSVFHRLSLTGISTLYHPHTHTYARCCCCCCIYTNSVLQKEKNIYKKKKSQTIRLKHKQNINSFWWWAEWRVAPTISNRMCCEQTLFYQNHFDVDHRVLWWNNKISCDTLHWIHSRMYIYRVVGGVPSINNNKIGTKRNT